MSFRITRRCGRQLYLVHSSTRGLQKRCYHGHFVRANRRKHPILISIWRFTTAFTTGGSEPFPNRFCQEGCDLREQAKWKLERATEAAIAAKRWDAAGIASFSLAELIGGDDAVVAAGALMLHQVSWVSCCRVCHR